MKIKKDTKIIIGSTISILILFICSEIFIPAYCSWIYKHWLLNGFLGFFANMFSIIILLQLFGDCPFFRNKYYWKYKILEAENKMLKNLIISSIQKNQQEKNHENKRSHGASHEK